MARPKFGAEYSSNSAYFIAGGRTLEIIRKFEDDVKNSEALLAAVAKDYGAIRAGSRSLLLEHEISHPALICSGQHEYRSGDDVLKAYRYEINKETPEGRALQERLDDIPTLQRSDQIFAKRLTGAEEVRTNPNAIDGSEVYNDRVSYHYGADTKRPAAFYHRYGRVYVVKVPRTVCAIFNEASEQATNKSRYDFKLAAGYCYKWFEPPDSKPIPYSKAIELQERALGDQTKPRHIKSMISTLASRLIRPAPPSPF